MMHVTFKWAGSLQQLDRFMFDFDRLDAPSWLQEKAAEAMKCETHAARVVYSNADLNLDLVLRPLESSNSSAKPKRNACLNDSWSLFKPVLKNIKASATTLSSKPCITLLVTQFSQTSLWIHRISQQDWLDAPTTFQTLPERARKTPCVALAAVEANSSCFKFFCPTLQSNRDFVLAAVKRNSNAMYYITAELRNDRKVALAAIRHNSGWLKACSLELRSDRNFVLAAVHCNGYALQFAGAKFQNDREVVLAAVGQCGEALHYANVELQQDKQISRAVAKQNGYRQ